MLIALWVTLDKIENTNVLDVGCGSGVISLILAQRLADLVLDYKVVAIDIDLPSKKEAEENFIKSDWASHLEAKLVSFENLEENHKFDLIISNPPYFKSGVINPATPRELARHQSILSPESLIERSTELLTEEGRLAMIVPSERVDNLKKYAGMKGLFIIRQTFVKGHSDAPVKRALLEFTRIPRPYSESLLILETEPGIPTDTYRSLGKDFYLYF